MLVDFNVEWWFGNFHFSYWFPTRVDWFVFYTPILNTCKVAIAPNERPSFILSPKREIAKQSPNRFEFISFESFLEACLDHSLKVFFGGCYFDDGLHFNKKKICCCCAYFLILEKKRTDGGNVRNFSLCFNVLNVKWPLEKVRFHHSIAAFNERENARMDF